MVGEREWEWAREILPHKALTCLLVFSGAILISFLVHIYFLAFFLFAPQSINISFFYSHPYLILHPASIWLLSRHCHISWKSGVLLSTCLYFFSTCLYLLTCYSLITQWNYGFYSLHSPLICYSLLWTYGAIAYTLLSWNSFGFYITALSKLPLPSSIIWNKYCWGILCVLFLTSFNFGISFSATTSLLQLMQFRSRSLSWADALWFYMIHKHF